jgi:AcrR family transcriptional regulator
MTDPPSVPKLRSVPRQKRSLERFHHILDVADQLFATQGYDAISTNHIAEAAGVAIGSLYHFFPDKETILQALVGRYGEGLRAVFPDDIAPPRTVADILTETLDRLITFKGRGAGLDWMLTSADSSGHHAIFYALHGQIVAWVDGLLAAHYPAIDAQDRRVCALCGVAIIKGMLPLTHPPDSVPAETLKAHAHLALMSYVEAFTQRLGMEAGVQA